MGRQGNGAAVRVEAQCRRCPRVESVEVERSALNRFELRAGLVQNLFPDLSASEREVVMGWRNGSFLCSSCWDEVFAEEAVPEPDDGLDRRERDAFEAGAPTPVFTVLMDDLLGGDV